MLVNPDIQDWLDKLQGRSPGRGGSAPRGGTLPNYGTEALSGIISPQRGMFGFNAPPISPRYQPSPILPSPSPRSPIGIAPAEPSTGGAGGRDLGGGAIAGGLGKLGQGLEQGLKNLQAKRAAMQQAQALVAPYSPIPPLRPGTPQPPVRPDTPVPPERPLFTQPGVSTTGGTGDYAPLGKVSETESLIRTEAAQRGIDPDVAVRVARSEGLNTYTGDKGSSFGPFQLHYGGVAAGGNSVSGLGDEFTRKTGLDARDPSTVPDQIRFALDNAAKGGWGPWHGAANSGIGNWQGIGQAPLASAPSPPSRPIQLAGSQPTANTEGQSPQLGPVQHGTYNGQDYTYQVPADPSRPPVLQPPTGASSVPVPTPPPGQQGYLQQPADQTNQLAFALSQGGPQPSPQLDQSALLAMALSQGASPDFAMPTFSAPAPEFDFGGFGGFGGLFG